MMMMQQPMLRDGFIRNDRVLDSYFDNVVEDGGKNPLHVDGCSCMGCQSLDSDTKDYLPGDNPVSSDDTIPGSTATTVTLTPGSAVSSAIDTAGDSDWFSIQLVAGQTYTFSTYLSGGGLRDSILTLRDLTGATIVSNDDANTGANLLYSEITFTASSTGTYYLDVTGFQTTTGGYILSSSRPLADAVGHTPSTAGSLTLGAAATAGDLDQTGDRDWYAVTLQAGQTYEFVTTATGGSNDADTTLTLRNASGAVQAFNDDNAGTYSRIRFVAETSGTYYLDVGGWADTEAGDYLVQASVAPPLQLFTEAQIADQLLNGYWGGPGSARSWDVSEGGSLTVNVTALTAEGQFLAREALALWSDVLGVTFTETTGSAQITFDDDEEGAFASTSRIGNTIQSVNVNISTDWLANSGTTLDSYSFQTYIHEIGHALGLGHGGNYNSSADYGTDASYLNDSWATTIMSYFDQNENDYFAGLNYSRVFSITPRGADIVAIQESYGAASTTRTGDTTYGVGNTSGRAVFGVGPEATTASGNLLGFTIVDHGGVDTLNYSTFSGAQFINLNPGIFSSVGGSLGNMSIARGTVIENVITGVGNDRITGNEAVNFFTGGRGNDILDGGSNVDTAIVQGFRTQYTITQTSVGVFTVTGPDGSDTLTNIEYLQFDNETIRLLPGTGVSVNFETADPSGYQSAMENIRDFDGNDLGGDGSWVRIGAADVDGDGDTDQILVNAAIGRFATLGAAGDGLYYFDDHSWAGETRVVGIYIDPLVASGAVEPFSEEDSQRRFQYDLQTSNIGRVLGADDYDGDGLQEVYFALADGTAYLHAYMHEDGNIRYANYQTEQQVIDFLTANGYGPATWSGWFPGAAGAEGDKNAPVMEPPVAEVLPTGDIGLDIGDGAKGVPVMELDFGNSALDPMLDNVLDTLAADMIGSIAPASEVPEGLLPDDALADIAFSNAFLEQMPQPPVEVFA